MNRTHVQGNSQRERGRIKAAFALGIRHHAGNLLLLSIYFSFCIKERILLSSKAAIFHAHKQIMDQSLPNQTAREPDFELGGKTEPVR